MARPKSNRVDYFPFDVNFFSDRRVRRVKRKCGIVGELAYILLLCNIYYDNEGYYTRLDSDLVFDTAESLGIEEDELHRIISVMFDTGLFEQVLYDRYGVLTSHGIQKRFQEIIKKRAQKSPVYVDSRFWLLDKSETLKYIACESFSAKNPRNSENNSEKQVKNIKNQAKNDTKESKGKESKLKESKANETKAEESKADMPRCVPAGLEAVAVNSEFAAAAADLNSSIVVNPNSAAAAGDFENNNFSEGGGDNCRFGGIDEHADGTGCLADGGSEDMDGVDNGENSRAENCGNDGEREYNGVTENNGGCGDNTVFSDMGNGEDSDGGICFGNLGSAGSCGSDSCGMKSGDGGCGAGNGGTGADESEINAVADRLLAEYREYIGKPSSYVGKGIKHFLEQGAEEALISRLIQYACEQGKRSWQYVESAVRGNLEDGIRTAEQYAESRKKRAAARGFKPVSGLGVSAAVRRSKFNNYCDENKPDYSNFGDMIIKQMLEEAE